MSQEKRPPDQTGKDQAPKSPSKPEPPQCSICRRRHGLEVIHACE